MLEAERSISRECRTYVLISDSIIIYLCRSAVGMGQPLRRAATRPRAAAATTKPPSDVAPPAAPGNVMTSARRKEGRTSV